MSDGLQIRRATSVDGPEIVQTVRAAIRGSITAYYSSARIEAWATGWGKGGIEDLLDNTLAFVA